MNPTVVFSNDNKTATVIAVNGGRVTVVAQDTLSVWFRKDGGVTLRTDAEHRSQTIRVDAYGRVFNNAATSIAVTPKRKRRLRVA